MSAVPLVAGVIERFQKFEEFLCTESAAKQPEHHDDIIIYNMRKILSLCLCIV